MANIMQAMRNLSFLDQFQGIAAFIYKCIVPNEIFSKLGVALGGISVLSLLSYALKIGFSNAIAVMIAWYDRFLEIVVGWIPIEWILEWVLAVFLIDLHVNPHWKHIFVVMNIYFIRNAFSYNHRREDGTIKLNVFTTIFVLVISVIISTLFSGLAGSYPPTGAFANFIIAWLPILGFYIYDLIERTGTVLVIPPKDAYLEFEMTKGVALGKYLRWATERFLGATVFVGLCSLIVFLGLSTKQTNYGVVIFLSVTFLLAIYWVSGRASLRFRYLKTEPGIPLFIRLMKYSGTTYLGVMMLGTLIWGAIFVVLNAGLGIAGL